MKTYLVSLPDGGTTALIFTLCLRINFKNKENAKGRGFVSSPQQRADVLTPPPTSPLFQANISVARVRSHILPLGYIANGHEINSC